MKTPKSKAPSRSPNKPRTIRRTIAAKGTKRPQARRTTARGGRQARRAPPAAPARRSYTVRADELINAPVRLASTGPDANACEPDAAANLENEIKLIRRLIQESAKQMDDADAPRKIALLNTLGAAAIRVATLLKTQKLLTGGRGEMDDLLQQALREVLEENSSA